MSVRTAPQAGFSLEYLMWIFIRISGLALFLLGFIGILGAFLMQARLYFQNGGYVDIGALARWTFFPISTHVSAYAPDLAAWSNIWWEVTQIMILFFAVTHGMNGVRQVIEDYVGGSWLRTILRGLIFITWMFFMIIGWTLITTNLAQ